MKKKINQIVIVLFVLSISFSCTSSKNSSSKIQYNFKSENGKPDFSNLDYWAAHPWKWDPSDSIPAPFLQQKTDSLVDVFFLHPTIYTENKRFDKINVAIDDAYNNKKTDYSSILYQASAFNQHARIFAPRFREAHISVYSMQDKTIAKQALDFAYEDVKNAFEFYLQNNNNGRPIIIASHSQGSTHALRLLKDFFENTPLSKQLVAAYVVGMPIPKNYFSVLEVCKTPLQTNCFCGWRTYKNGFVPEFVKKGTDDSWVTNPLSWEINTDYANKKLNEGGIFYNFNKPIKSSAGAKIFGNILWVDKPKFPGSIFYFSKNYHIADINLFYTNIRSNVEARIFQFLKQ